MKGRWLGWLAVWMPLSAWGLTGAEVMARAQEEFAGHATFSARFEKKFYWTALDKTQSLQGRLYTRRPDQFRLEVEGGDLMVADGQAIWVYSKKNQQVVVSPYDGQVQTPWQVLLDYAERFAPAGVEEVVLGGKPCYLLTLHPAENPAAEQMQVWIERQRWVPLKVEQRDASENRITYLLEDHQLDKKLEASLFRFEVPPGVEVIDRRGNGGP